MADIPEWLEKAENDTTQISLFNAPAPPTGPTADKYSREEGKPHAFIKFALDAFRRQEKRFSTRTFLARYRDDEKVRINDHFSPWFADQLVTNHPQLIDIIERRIRKKEGPPIQSNGHDI